MAEPHNDFAKNLAGIFSKEYNRQNGTNFQWDNTRSHQGKRPKVDFVLYDGEKELEIQHTTAVADEVREYVRPAKVRDVVYKIVEDFEKDPNIPELFIDLNIFNLPKTLEEKKKLIFYLEIFIEEKARQRELSLFTYHADFDDQIFPDIKDYVDRLNILPYPHEHKPKVVFSMGSSEKEIRGWIGGDQRVINAIERKKETECILLIESGMFGIDPYYEKEILEYCKTTTAKAKEIWIVEAYLGGERAIRVK